ncbi:hypothetical protein HPP92_028790 [Vanilla planifolia]|uniref:Uncharacterized protein n=1 Tax=Vanilla planifolia TaxID=51239 RepID=A0A835P6E0_VANPL|nr:hypothetical protein HPP92_028790 [Vanilla planifolia]KAG0446555.1 hypothetical protein HPP92_028779 [Vanilla planifolia]
MLRGGINVGEADSWDFGVVRSAFLCESNGVLRTGDQFHLFNLQIIDDLTVTFVNTNMFCDGKSNHQLNLVLPSQPTIVTIVLFFLKRIVKSVLAFTRQPIMTVLILNWWNQ